MSDKRGETEIVLAELARLAEIAAGILDGEEIKQVITAEAMHYIANPDPRYRFLAGDYYDVDSELFLRTKKLLLRIERLGHVPVDSSVWVPVPGRDAITLAVQNGVNHRYYTFGQEQLATPPAIQRVFDSSAIESVGPNGDAPPQLATALAPVKDSLGDVVGVAEFTALLTGNPASWN
ncbi:MAG: hypothetical protein GKR89_24820 [Candidatus Latescibacteria bacterium]|nr:hypothetical protein [Candidatus Latescibacterota bacterium]